MKIEKRRTDRLMLTIPLRVKGTDPKGRSFECEARTLILNCHGARIAIVQSIASGQRIRITNLVGRREADFRVVGPTSPATEQGGEWGVEYLNLKDNIWGIQFPPPAPGGADDSAALLECLTCHAVALRKVSLVEVDVLSTSGIVSKPCENCNGLSRWGYAEKQLAMDGCAGEAGTPAEPHGAGKESNQRRHRRVSLQLPVLIRDYNGGVEITRSENVSKGGFCFTSEKDFQIGEGIMAACPYSGAEKSLEVRARIVRRRAVEGSNRKIYGVRYN